MSGQKISKRSTRSSRKPYSYPLSFYIILRRDDIWVDTVAVPLPAAHPLLTLLIIFSKEPRAPQTAVPACAHSPEPDWAVRPVVAAGAAAACPPNASHAAS